MDVWEVCAAGRGAESLAQPGGTRRDVPGPSGLPEGESRREQQHAREAGDRPKTPEASPRKARLIRRKLDCLNPNPQRRKDTLVATASWGNAARGGPIDFLGPPPPTGEAMAGEAIEGDEWGAYVRLGRSAPPERGMA